MATPEKFWLFHVLEEFCIRPAIRSFLSLGSLLPPYLVLRSLPGESVYFFLRFHPRELQRCYAQTCYF